MNIYPSYTIGTIFAVGMGQSILVCLALSSALSRVDFTTMTKNLTRLGVAAILVIWFGLMYSFSMSNSYLAPTQPGGLERVLLALFSPAVVGLLLLSSATIRKILDQIPQHQLIGFQGIRFAGFIFLVLMDMGLLSPTFAVAAKPERAIYRDCCKHYWPARRVDGNHIGPVCGVARLVCTTNRLALHVCPVICRILFADRTHLFITRTFPRHWGSTTHFRERPPFNEVAVESVIENDANL